MKSGRQFLHTSSMLLFSLESTAVAMACRSGKLCLRGRDVEACKHASCSTGAKGDRSGSERFLNVLLSMG